MKLYETINLACSEHNNRLHTRSLDHWTQANRFRRHWKWVHHTMQQAEMPCIDGNKTDLYFPRLSDHLLPFVSARCNRAIRRNISPGSSSRHHHRTYYYWKALIDCLAEIMARRWSPGTFRNSRRTAASRMHDICVRPGEGSLFYGACLPSIIPGGRANIKASRYSGYGPWVG